jgi:hypothetical protein
MLFVWFLEECLGHMLNKKHIIPCFMAIHTLSIVLVKQKLAHTIMTGFEGTMVAHDHLAAAPVE